MCRSDRCSRWTTSKFPEDEGPESDLFADEWRSMLKTLMNSFKIFQTNATVTLKQGMLQGTEGKLFDGRPYYSFKGIPYALAMTAERRFEVNILKLVPKVDMLIKLAIFRRYGTFTNPENATI